MTTTQRADKRTTKSLEITPASTLKKPDAGTSTVGSAVTTMSMLPSAPWPAILLASIGAVGVIYAAVAPNVDENRRVFGIVFSILWCMMFAIIMWAFWCNKQENSAWWLFVLSLSLYLLFFILIIMFNIGQSL